MEGGVVYAIFFHNPKVVYVGSSFTYWRRWSDHLRKLRKGRHYNAGLQKAFNEQGEFKMRFVPLVFLGPCTAAALEAAEHYWINFYVEKVGYEACLNRSPMAASPGEVREEYSPAI